MAKQNSTYFSPTCFFCGKNNKRRHSRVGRTWRCGHCGEVNPGPGMVRSMMAKLGNGHAEKREPVAAPAAPRKVAVTSITGTEATAVAAAKPKSKAEPARKPAAAAPAATQKSKPTPKPSAPPPASPKRGFLEGLVYG